MKDFTHIKLDEINEQFKPHLADSSINHSTCYFYIILAGKLSSPYPLKRLSSNSLEVTNIIIESMFWLTRREREHRQKALCKIGFLQIIKQTGGKNIFTFLVGVGH